MSSNGQPSTAERAMQAVRRELFLPPAQRSYAAEDAPLPIGCAQTISQPSLVNYMTEQLEVSAQTRVLEIGTGSGYQTAILAELAAEVFTIERIRELADSARMRLLGLGYRNIHFRVGDGAQGWPEAAPFDRIMVTAAAGKLPAALTTQLAPGGRLVVPVGDTTENQVLLLITKGADGAIQERELCAVRFVPLITGK
jgi:protein-L-isoaspartate(D-aspartate) O-methyltransferase